MCKPFNWRLPRGHAASCSTLISSVCFHWFRVSMQFIHYDELWWKSIWGVNCMIRLYFNKISIKVVSFPKVVIHCCIHSYGWHFSPTFTKRLASFAALENGMRLRQNPAETCRGWTIWGPFCTNRSIHFRAIDLILNLLNVVQHTHTRVDRFSFAPELTNSQTPKCRRVNWSFSHSQTLTSSSLQIFTPLRKYLNQKVDEDKTRPSMSQLTQGCFPP